ncbi:hypothetical protein AU252_12350 [Pseudarthrobacter sulfonivorans]|uniref:Lipoprotein n=1 Tax=Pseudarthrobacter sulfonivorans TaxID=121292 RepID=A0A0U3QYB1_9MICC|nr:hypothetical protein [Pseudarthrobacter sulfonivorans]ALV41852.1 hypothetical protein AU252_12350 [Pseudarthrobacter sulfonivorans]
MKKLATALIAAGLVLSASACTTPTKLSTPETCDRVKAVLANPANNVGKTGLVRLANQIRPIEVVASDDLKPALGSIIAFTDESAKEAPDEAKLAELEAQYQEAGAAFTKHCS